MAHSYIKFTPYIDIGFWKELSRRKLDDWKLDESLKTVYGKYQVNKFKDVNLKLNFDVYSFEQPTFSVQGPLEVYLRGKIKMFNVFEDFNKMDLPKIMAEFKAEQQKNLENFDPSNGQKTLDDFSLNHDWFLTTIFADLKKHVFFIKFYQVSDKTEVIGEVSEGQEHPIRAISPEDFGFEDKLINLKTQYTDLTDYVNNSVLFTMDKDISITVDAVRESECLAFTDCFPDPARINRVFVFF